MNRLLSKSFTENPKPVVTHLEGSAIQNRKWAGIVALVIAFAMCGAMAQAQQSDKVPRIGFLRGAVPPQSHIEAFRHGLKQLGYIEGKNIAMNGATREVSVI